MGSVRSVIVVVVQVVHGANIASRGNWMGWHVGPSRLSQLRPKSATSVRHRLRINAVVRGHGASGRE
eukprot:6273069-Pyramimonas_sp.AAC.1